MATSLFGDKIISATDLKNNQKAWFTKALKTPISITQSGGHQFVLINRDQIHNLVLIRNYSEKIIKYCSESQSDSSYEFNVFPWVKDLSEEDRKEFRDELILAFTRLMNDEDGNDIEEIIEAWEATAEALKNDKFMEVVNDRESKREYIDVE